MEGIKPPNSLKLQGNLDFQWRSFKQRFLLYVDATQDWTDVTPDNKKMALFLHVAGDEAIELYNTMVFDTTEVRNYANVFKRFEEYCCPKKNETYERYIFRNRIQEEGEPFEQFALDLKTKAQTCCFDRLSESMIRDQIVYGINDKKVRERLLRTPDLTREQAEAICKAAEISKEQTRIFENTKDNSAAYFKNISSIDSIQSRDKEYKGNRLTGLKLPKQNNREPGGSMPRDNICGNCNRTHGYRECPAYKKMCNKCSKLNHFAVVCRAKSKAPVKVHVVEDRSEMDTYYIDSIKNTQDANEVEDWWIDVILNGETVKFKIDTGAQSNTLPIQIYESWHNKPIKNKRSALLEAYGGSFVKSFGSFKTIMEALGKKEQVHVVLVGNDHQPLLGLKACEQFGIVRRMYVLSPEQGSKRGGAVTKNYILQKFPELFAKLGCVKEKHTIRLKEGYIPAVYAARRVAHALKDKLKAELNRMLKGGIIRKIDEPTEWVNPIVLVQKGNGDIRICLDPKQLNNSICREYFQIPTREQIEAELAGAAYFSKLDASQGFYQIPLDGKSEVLCTFNTPFGRFCFKRLPFGIASAPEVFHKTINQIYEGMEGIKTYIDDVLVWGATREEHDQRLIAALEKTKQSGLTLNKDKCVIGVQEITFLGEQLTKDGMKPNPVKIKAVKEMPLPQIKEDVHRALGLITYLGKYIPNLADKTKSLRGLLKRDAHMEWGPEHQEEWNNLTETLCKTPILQFYDAKLPLKIATDASKGGLGAVLMQYTDTWLPVAYASRTMTEMECRYAQIEKEALGLVFGCERFHEYVYGRNFILETDHKPLTAIIKKEIAAISPRLQRMFIRLLKYTFELKYIPGKTLIVADALSRAPIRQTQNEIEKDIKIHTVHAINYLAVNNQKLKLIREETEKDWELQEVIQQIQGSWASRIGGERYRNYKDDLTYVEGVVLKGNRIVMPKSIRKLMLRKLHEGHLGQNKCRARARQVMFWPGMVLEIIQMINQCPTGRKYQYRMQKEPMIIRPDPGIPWYRVGSDLFMFGGKDYLLTIDAHSNYPEVDKLEDTRATTVIAELKGVFARHGIPQEVLTDNGPQYTSREFKEFAKEFEFQHVTSSPYYPCSNGLAEKGVQIAKRIMKKALDAEEDWSTGLMNYRSTPLESGKSPAELLMGRNIKTKLPEWHGEEGTRDSKTNKHRQDERKGKEMRQLEAGEIVRIWDGACWNKKAEVMGQVAPRSYQIQTEERALRRNRSHLLPTEEALEQEEGVVETDLEPLIYRANKEVNQLEPPLQNDLELSQHQKSEASNLQDPGPSQLKESGTKVRRSSRDRKPKIRMNL